MWMAPSVLYHCPCLSASAVPPPPHLQSSSRSFHPLHTLFFCEECDAVRCNRCVSVEVSSYYCPNCLFEVPSASVRSEKNRQVLERDYVIFKIDAPLDQMCSKLLHVSQLQEYALSCTFRSAEYGWQSVTDSNNLSQWTAFFPILQSL